MESLSERNESQRAENAKKWHRRKIQLAIGAAVSVVLFLVIFNIWSYYTKDYRGYKVVDTTKRLDSNGTNYTVYNGSKLMKYSRDGAVGFNEKLDMTWSGSYNFASPIYDSCGEYVVLADQGGTEACVFDGSDSPKEIKVLYPISHVSISHQGVLAVVMERDSSDFVQIYNAVNGELLVEFNTNVSEDGYPVDIALSEDGTKLVTVYLNVTNGKPVSKLTFYNLGEVGKNYANNIVSAKTFEKEIVSRVEFMGNDTVCAFTEQGYHLYAMKQVVHDIDSKTFKKKIKSVFLTEENFGFVFEPQGSEERQKVELYDLSGKARMSEYIDFPYNTVYMIDKEIVFIAEQECHILRKNGREKLNCNFKSPVTFILPTEGFNRYILVADNSIDIVKIKED